MRPCRFLTVPVSGVALAAVGVGCATVPPVGSGLKMKDDVTGAPAGESIRQATVEGYHLEYYLLALGDAPVPRGPTHHLMLYLTGPDGKPVEDAQAVYRVTGPGGPRPEVRAFYTKGRRVVRRGSGTPTAAGAPMEGGYGADISLPDRASYRVATQIVTAAVTLRDEFAYEMR